MPLNDVYLIGLTGNIACGKSTVLDMLRERGAQVLDADRVTRELQSPSQPVYHAIVAEFGPGILSAPAGPIDRRALGAIVFADPAALRRLEQIVHPAVRERLMSWLEFVAASDQGLGIGRPAGVEKRSRLSFCGDCHGVKMSRSARRLPSNHLPICGRSVTEPSGRSPRTRPGPSLQ